MSMTVDDYDRVAEELRHVANFLDEHASVLVDHDIRVLSPYIQLSVNTNPHDDEDDDARRARIIAVLGDMARRLTSLGRVEKSSGEYTYRLEVGLGGLNHPRTELSVSASVDAVCTIETTDELVEVERVIYPEPVRVKTMQPKTIKHCPPSLLAGIEVEV